MPSFSKNLEKFLVFFFSAVSLILLVMGITRIKKPSLVTETTPAPSPVAPQLADSSGTTVVEGNAFQTPWGNAIASITVKSGKIVAVTMPSVPNSPPSIYAEPYLIDQALKAGSANIQGVSGATYTSIAFKSSLESAISKANTQGQSVSGNTGVTSVSAPVAKPSVPRKYRDDEESEWGGFRF